MLFFLRHRHRRRAPNLVQLDARVSHRQTANSTDTARSTNNNNNNSSSSSTNLLHLGLAVPLAAVVVEATLEEEAAASSRG